MTENKPNDSENSIINKLNELIETKKEEAKALKKIIESFEKTSKEKNNNQNT